MAPLTWAIGKSLNYKPTSNNHYIACQLFRWKNNNLGPQEMNEVLDFIIETTLKNDYFCEVNIFLLIFTF